MLNRRLMAFGMPLVVAYTVVPVLATVLLNYIYTTYNTYPYIFGMLSFFTLIRFQNKDKDDFLKSIYGESKVIRIRLIEHILLLLPVLLFLLLKIEFLLLFIILSFCIILSFVNLNINAQKVTPTPFFKYPFEAIIGFRKTFFLLPLAYILTYIAISAANVNLAIFSFISIALICMSFYSKPEHPYYVWIYAVSTRDFLFEKLKIGVFSFTLLSLPAALIVALCFTSELLLIATCYWLCYLYLTTYILAKYDAFPEEVNVPEVLLIGLSLLFPPSVLLLLIYFYRKARNKIHYLLND